MSNQISLTIPNDDPIALRAFGNALEEMAVAHGAEVRKSVAAMTVKIDGTEAAQAVRGVLEEFAEEPLRPSPRTAQALREADDIEVAHSGGFTDDDTQLATNDTLDADGLPWDARIHSGNQERNADSTWRSRRKPKDVTPEQWSEQVAQVREELFALMAIPVADPVPVVADECTGDSTCTDQGCPHHYADESPAAVFGASDPVEVPPTPPAPEPLPVVTVADPVPPAPESLPPVGVADPVPPAPESIPVVTPPAPAPLPPVAATGAIPTTMADFMTSLTKYGPKDPSNKDECAAHVARVNEIVARHGLVSVGQLAKRLDLIPQVYADLVKELGQ